MKTFLAILAGLALVIAMLVVWAGTAERPEAWDPPPPPPPLADTPGTFTLDVGPKRAKVDQPTHVVVRGVASNESVVLRAWTEDASGERFESWARFAADANGVVDTTVLSPSEGTYRTADGGGLLWSMRTSDATAYDFPSNEAEIRYRFSAETAQGVVHASLTRDNPIPTMTLEVVNTERVDAQFWLPPNGEEQLPAVVRLHGSEGAFNPLRAALLASNGFAVLDLRYVDSAGLPEIVAIPLETVMYGIDWLSEHPRVDASRIGVYGGSKGAELALYASTVDPRIRAVVAWAPASVAFEGISLSRLRPGSSWSWQGQPVDYAAYQIETLSTLRHVVRVLFREASFLPIYERALDQAPAAAEIPVEKIAGAILLLAGSDDRMWPSVRMATLLDARLERHDHPNYETVVYDGSGHRMRYALWPDQHEPSRFVGGGSPEANHVNGGDGWQRIKAFFDRELKRSAGG
ncbi:MAG: acyl-CoA thioester hydrolase/BAAT C-terminal domain-containing protein [Pseudomonadales bacterium]